MCATRRNEKVEEEKKASFDNLFGNCLDKESFPR